MSKVIITVGISGSGKTTWAKEQKGFLNTNRDDLRLSLWGCDKTSDLPYNKEGQLFLESLVTKIQRLTIKEAIENNRDIIVSDTNLNNRYRNDLINFCEELGATVEIKEFEITFDEAIKRSASRQNGVTHSIIYKQLKQWDDYKNKKIIKHFSSSKVDAIIVDIDGTLAHMVDRNPFDFHKVSSDVWDEDVLRIIRSYLKEGFMLIICSGRENSCEKETREWLDQKLKDKYKLHMRVAGDRRPDDIVKEEIFWNEIDPYHNIYAVIDDRPKVIRMWFRIGIRKVIAVANPFEEF